jgi:hypothetical protein
MAMINFIPYPQKLAKSQEYRRNPELQVLESLEMRHTTFGTKSPEAKTAIDIHG